MSGGCGQRSRRTLRKCTVSMRTGDQALCEWWPLSRIQGQLSCPAKQSTGVLFLHRLGCAWRRCSWRMPGERTIVALMRSQRVRFWARPFVSGASPTTVGDLVQNCLARIHVALSKIRVTLGQYVSPFVSVELFAIPPSRTESKLCVQSRSILAPCQEEMITSDGKT